MGLQMPYMDRKIICVGKCNTRPPSISLTSCISSSHITFSPVTIVAWPHQ